MPIVTLTLTNQPLNVSCQVGDTIYYVNTQAGDVEFTVNDGNVVEVGTLVQIQNATTSPILSVYSTLTGWENELTGEQFILFSKNNKANLSSPLGYFAELKMSTNAVTAPSELHAVNMDMFTSSK